jgi:2-hydroxy-6-oxonona-2,4-dienedioate hydrolase
MRRVVLFVSAAAALAAAMVYMQYRADLSTARQRLLAGSQLAQTACGPVEYTVVGSGPAVLVIHGAGGGYSQAQRFTQALADAGFTAIAMSRFGYLRTPLPADGSPA